jgi:hypothetical protein
MIYSNINLACLHLGTKETMTDLRLTGLRISSDDLQTANQNPYLLNEILSN